MSEDRVTRALLGLADPFLAPGAREDTLAALSPTEIDALLTLARATAVHACVAQALLAAPPALVPATARARAESLREHAVFRELRQRRLLRRALEALATRGLPPPLLLKGAALRETLYPAPWLRTMDDLDLLVRPAHAAEAEAALATLGLRPRAPDGRRRATERAWHSRTLLAAQSGTRIDLHRAAARPGRFSVDPEAIFAEARPLSVDGRPALAPSPAHSLVTLCVHQAEMGGRGSLKRFVDLALLLREPSLRWEEVERSARAWGATGALTSMLWLTSHITGSPLPPRLLERLGARTPRHRLLRSLVAPPAGAPFAAPRLARPRALLLLYWLPDDRRTRLRFLADYLGLRARDLLGAP